MKQSLGAKTLLLSVVLVIALHAGPQAAQMPPEKSEQARRLLRLVEGLDKKKDVEGLLSALQSAQNLPPHDQGWVIPRIINALRRVEPGNLKGDGVVDALAAVAKMYSGAVLLLGEIGTEKAGRVVADLAKTSPDQIVRRSALSLLGKFKSPAGIKLLIDTAANTKEKPEFRRAALNGLKRSALTEEQYRALFDIAVKDPSDPIAGAVFEPAVVMRRVPDGAVSAGGHLAAMRPLLDALEALSQRIEALQGKESQTKARGDAAKCFKRGFSALHVSLPPMAKRIGYSVRFGRRLSVARGGKEVFSYRLRDAKEDAGERTRVLAFWRKWWDQNKEAVLKAAPDGRPGSKAKTPKDAAGP